MEIITLQNINQYRKVLLVIKLHCQKNIILGVNSYHFIVYKIPFSSTFARRLLKLVNNSLGHITDNKTWKLLKTSKSNHCSN